MKLLNEFEQAMVAAETSLFGWPKTSAESAATPVAETSIGLIGPGNVNIAIGSAQFHPAAALAASDTNYATLQCFKRTGGGAGVLLATINTTLTVAPFSGNWTAWLPVPMQLQTGAGSYVAPGDAITFAITKTGTGVSTPQGQFGAFVLIG